MAREPFHGRTCQCGGRKGFYAKLCRACKHQSGTWPKPNLGKRREAHPAWKGGRDFDRDGYVRSYAPDHPWPRSNGYVREHVRIMELRIGRRLLPDETVHHRDHDRLNNELSNLELLKRGEHSRHHRKLDTANRRRDSGGRFA